MPYPRDLTDDQWALLEPVFKAPGKRARKHVGDLRTVVDAMLYIAQTRVSVALSPRVVRAVDAGLGAVSPLVAQTAPGRRS